MGDIGKYLSTAEMTCKCGCGFCDVDPMLSNTFDWIRLWYGKPLIVSSGCRCEKYNKEQGGEENSAHLRGKAVDILINNTHDRFIIDKLAKECGVKRIGKGKGFIHIDVDDSLPQEVEWLYT